MGDASVGRVGPEALQETVAGTVLRRPSEDHVLRGHAQQPGEKQHHQRHVQSVFRHERLTLNVYGTAAIIASGDGGGDIDEDGAATATTTTRRTLLGGSI